MQASIITDEMIQQTQAFHGHMCAGLAIGIRAAELALRDIGAHAQDEEVVAVVETDMCGVDAIQFLVGCTFGKGNLIHLDYGKNAFTFYHRADGKGVRVVTRSGALDPPDPEFESLRDRQGKGDLSPEEQQRFQELYEARTQQILTLPLEKLFELKQPEREIPQHARIMESLTCDACGEGVMETRTRRSAGKTVCIPCFEKLDQR